MTYWSKEETFKLISIWSKDNIQAQLEGYKRNREVYTKILSCELSVAGYIRTYKQCQEELKKLKVKELEIRGRRQGKVGDYYDAMDGVLGRKPSTQPAVVVDILEDSQVQDTQVDDDELQQTEIATPTSLDTSDTTVPSPASTDVTDASCEVATTSQGQKKGIDGADKVPSRKQKKSRLDVTGELLDKLIGMQEKSDKMMMELEMKRARLEKKQMEMDMQMRREERQFQLQMTNIMTCNSHSTLPLGPNILCIYTCS